MGDIFQSVLTICGFGMLSCCALGFGVIALLLFSGRAVMIPAVLALAGQIVTGVLGGAVGLVSGSDDRGRAARRADDGDDDDDAGRPRSERGLSASERLARRRARFEQQRGGTSPAADDDWLAQRDPRRGRVGDDFSTPDAPDIGDFGPPPHSLRSNPNRARRDTRRTERTDDEVFGGMLDDDGDGHADF